MRKILESCPACSEPLTISELTCPSCSTTVRGQFEPGPFSSLTADQASFLLRFVQVRGNLTELEKALGVSYPTIRAKLDELLRVLSPRSVAPTAEDRRRDILSQIASGHLDPTAGLAALRDMEDSGQRAEK